MDNLENFGDNTETIAIVSYFLWPAMKSSNEARKIKCTRCGIRQSRLTGTTSEELRTLFSSELYP